MDLQNNKGLLLRDGKTNREFTVYGKEEMTRVFSTNQDLYVVGIVIDGRLVKRETVAAKQPKIIWRESGGFTLN